MTMEFRKRSHDIKFSLLYYEDKTQSIYGIFIHALSRLKQGWLREPQEPWERSVKTFLSQFYYFEQYINI